MLLAALPSGAAAQVMPAAGPGDPRIQIVPYDADQVVQLAVAPNYQLTIEFAPDERIENVALGDADGWSATPNKRGDHLFVKAMRAGAGSNLLVVTDARTYNFELTPLYGPTPTMTFVLRFSYPVAAAATMVADASEAAAAGLAGRYRLNGDKALRPLEMDDDGTHTRIRWAPEQAMPAVFALDARRQETLVNGEVRDGVYVLDAVYARLVFRLDRHAATATRKVERR